MKQAPLFSFVPTFVAGVTNEKCIRQNARLHTTLNHQKTSGRRCEGNWVSSLLGISIYRS